MAIRQWVPPFSQTSTLSAGGASITVSSASLSGAEFSLSGISLPMTITPGQSVPVTMTFTSQSSGAASAVLSITSNALNAAAQNLSGVGVAPTQHSVSLSWTDSNSRVVRYNVYRGSRSGGPYAQINERLDTTHAYDDTSVAAGQTFYYVARAVDGSGVRVDIPKKRRVQSRSPKLLRNGSTTSACRVGVANENYRGSQFGAIGSVEKIAQDWRVGVAAWREAQKSQRKTLSRKSKSTKCCDIRSVSSFKR